ncbi:DUF3857 domain-containing protein [Sphingobacterium hungaricum]
MKLFSTLVWLFAVFYCQAQQLSMKPFKPAQFETTCTELDSSANAFVIEEYGNTEFDAAGASELKLIHYYSVRIKIINQEGFDKANFKIPLYRVGDKFEIISSIKGKTYNLVDGKVVTTELEKDNIFTEKYSDNLQFCKLTLPNIQEGSIIELKYQITSESLFQFRSWMFQDDIPKLYSAFVSEIPKNFVYNITVKGRVPMFKKETVLKTGCFNYNNEMRDCFSTTYIMKDIPAFVQEDYMLSPINYLAAVTFELKHFQDENGMVIKNFTKTWKDVDELMMADASFGGQLKKTNSFKKILPPIIENKSNNYDKSKAIYSYIQNQIKWNNYYGCFSQKGIEESLKIRTGNAADINLALVTALNAADIEAYPVVLSTRENGLPNMFHPVISDFNYVIALAIIDSTKYFLDATEQYNPFGELPLRTINHNGRVIYSKKSSEWLPMVNPRISSSTYQFDGELLTNGELKGILTFNYAGIDALNKRKEISSAGNDDLFKEELENSMTSAKIDSIRIFNFSEIDNVLNIQLGLTYTLLDNQDEDSQTLSFNPIFLNKTTKNPFNLDERTYPVDLGSLKENSQMIKIRIPDGYTLKEKPANSSLALPERAARYVFKAEFKDQILSVHQSVLLNKSLYLEDEYLDLKEFYSRLIQHQKLDFVFTKN